MMGAFIRSVGSVIAGLSVAFFFVIGVEFMSSIVHPFPPGVDPTDPEACRAHVARYPASVLMLVVFLWGMAVFVSSWLATRLGTGRHPAHGFVVGAILFAAVVFNMAMLPYPNWFWLNLVVFPISFVGGATRAMKRPVQPLPFDGPPAN